MKNSQLKRGLETARELCSFCKTEVPLYLRSYANATVASLLWTAFGTPSPTPRTPCLREAKRKKSSLSLGFSSFR
jgi:hypothetical protein